MVPIHDTDVAEERWTHASWDNYELWEKIEVRERRKKRLWILASVIVFLILSAIPITIDRSAKWSARGLVRKLALELNHVKRDSILNRSAYRFRFLTPGSLEYVVERVKQCSESKGEQVRSGTLGPRWSKEKFTWISPNQGKDFGIPGLTQHYCFDELQGSDSPLREGGTTGFGIISVKDLAEKRPDRISLLVLTGVLAESSFD